jgi:hypothetical protein
MVKQIFKLKITDDLIPSLFLVILLAGVVQFQNNWTGSLFLIFFLVLLINWINQPRALILEDGILALKYFFKTRNIPVADVLSIAEDKQTIGSGYRAGTIQFIRLKLVNGDVISLSGFAREKEVLYKSLIQWREEHKD